MLTMCLAFSATAAGPQTDSKRIDEIVSKTLDGQINFDDIVFVLKQDKKAGSEILKYLDEISIPAEPDIESDETSALSSSSNDEIRHYTVEYNTDTKEEKTVYEDFLDVKPKVSEVEGDDEGTEENDLLSSPILRSTDWSENNPQLYKNTKSIFKLFIQSSSGNIIEGSAFKISGNYLGTAGHCVFGHQEGFTGWASSILCIPAYRIDNPNNPLGDSYAVSNNMAVGGNWRDYQNVDDDWGVLQLSSVVNTGYMGKRCVGDNTNINGRRVRIAGYPAEPGISKKMFLSWGNVFRTNRRLVECDCTTYLGMSGCPVIDTDDHIIGIFRAKFNSDYAIFVKFDDWIYNKMCSYD